MDILKSDIRSRCLAVRGQMGIEDRLAADTGICRRLGDLVSSLHPDTVSVFWPIERLLEIDTRPFINDLVQSDIAVALPCISQTEPGVMRMRRFSGENELVENKWGAGEPLSGDLVSPADINLVVVPALGVSHNGHRVGYGQGYYDRFLQGIGCPTVVIVYSPCLLDRIPADRHDIPVTYVVTELDTIVTVNPAT